jgi:hypothetical protein
VAVLSHTEVTLYKVVKGSIKVKSICLTITEELVHQGKPQVARWMTTLPNNLLKIGSDHVGDRAEDNNVHPDPRRIVGEGDVRENMVGEGVPCQGHQHQVTPDGIVGGHSVQHDVHQLTNVWNCHCLNVEVGDECRVVGDTIDHVGRSRGRGGRR